LEHRFDSKTFEVFDPIIDVIHKNLRPKISLVGFSGVGKTTITKLIRAEEIPMQHIPTITGDIATVRIGKLHFHLWDFAGQEQFSYLWNNFVKGSDAVLLITDSTLENIEKSKFFLDLVSEQAAHAHTAVIANKQDLKQASKPSQIERILGLKTYSMIAKDPSNRDKMIQIIADILEMSAEVSPLLKPLLERDKLIEEATNALKTADFDKAAILFDKISDLCIELGDDSLSKEFFEKSQKIKNMINQVDTPQPKTIHTIEADRQQQIEEPSQLTTTEEPMDKEAPHLEEKKLDTPIPPEVPPKEITKSSLIPHKVHLKPKIKQEISKKWVEGSKGVPRTEEFKKPEIISKDTGLKLNPEDFMVKIRPKSVKYVPKDAKSKLKTSAFGQVKNSKEPEIPIPITPTNLMKEKSTIPTSASELQKTDKILPSEPIKNSTEPITTTPIFKRQEQEIPPQEVPETVQPTPLIEEHQRGDLKKSLIELKLKKANINKMSLDYDMKELTGEISKEELIEKKKKLAEFEKKVNEQIEELQKLLND